MIRGTPTFTPSYVTAGSITPISLSAAAIDGDLIVIQQNDCSQAHLAGNPISWTPKQEVLGFLAWTSGQMTTLGTYWVCYATSESGGLKAGDFGPLAGTITMLPQPSFGPIRTVSGATQDLIVNGALGRLQCRLDKARLC